MRFKISEIKIRALAFLVSAAMIFSGAMLLTSCNSSMASNDEVGGSEAGDSTEKYEYELLAPAESLPEYKGEPYVSVNGNIPDFSDEEKHMTEPMEQYSKMDRYGRCGVAFANICKELMPTEKRESIGMIKPSGWQTVRYDDLVDGKYLYNRCHLIGFQLAGENANELNLITGTRYMNVDGMLPWEDSIADYVKQSGNHVLYRVTPIFEGKELVARGVQMEAYSVEDNGEGICFNVYAFNVQPGVEIDYMTGESRRAVKEPQAEDEVREYVLNTSSKKFHNPECSGAKDIKQTNREEYKGTREKLIDKGYEPCGRCNP